MDFTLNGKTVVVDATPGRSLLDVLRGECGLRSMKDGCAPEGSCGACTVIVDGHAVVSCARPAERVAGRSVETLEGLAADVRSLWADAFVATGASQCGYCSPGIVMKAEALLRRDPEPSREAIARALAGNLCRCTGYASIIDAIALTAAVRRGEAAGVEPVTGPRYEGRELALGEKPFVGDLVAPGMLHGALRFAGVPRALVRSIDTAAARAVPGVVAVLTAADVPGRREQGLIRPDWPLLVAEGEIVRYVGDVLAAVAAETREAAAAAAALIEVELEALPAVTDPFAALADGAPEIHEGGNVVSRSVVRRGDVDAALAGAAHVASASFRTAAIEHAFLEPEAALAVPRGAVGPDGATVTAHRVHVYSPGQGAWEDRRQVASFLGLDAGEVLVTQVSTGGAFGGKEDLSVQGQAALLAFATGRPVLLKLTRRESLWFHVKRHPMWLDYTAGCDAEGNLVAVRARITGDNGAYASVGGKVLERAAGHACGPFRVPNVDVEATAVYTNNPPSGAMRGFGANQADFAMEGVLDMLAESVGHRRLGHPLAQRARRGRPHHDRPEAGRGRRREGHPPRGQGRLQGRPVRGHRVRHQERGRRQRPQGARARGPPPRRGRHRHAVPLLDRDGPGLPHGLPRPRGGRAGDRPGPDPGGRGHAPRAGHGRDDLVAGHDARRARGPGRLRDAARRSSPRPRRPAGGPGRTGLRGRGRRGLDHQARGRRGRARDALRLRLGDPGGDPRRRGPPGADRRGARRGQGAQPGPAEGPGRGRGPHGPGHGPDRGVRDRRRHPRHRDAQVAGHHPGGRDAPGGDDPGGGRRSPRARSARRAWARPSWSRPRPPWRARSTRSTASGGPACRCATRPPPGRCCPGWPAMPRRRRRRHGREEGSPDVRGHPGPRLRAPPPVLGARAGDARPAQGRHELPGDPGAGLVAPGHGPRPRDDPLVGHARRARGARERDHRDHRPPRVPQRHRGQPGRDRRGVRRGRRPIRAGLRDHRSPRAGRRPAGPRRERALHPGRRPGPGGDPRRLHLLRRVPARRGRAGRGARGGRPRPRLRGRRRCRRAGPARRPDP